MVKIQTLKFLPTPTDDEIWRIFFFIYTFEKWNLKGLNFVCFLKERIGILPGKKSAILRPVGGGGGWGREGLINYGMSSCLTWQTFAGMKLQSNLLLASIFGICRVFDYNLHLSGWWQILEDTRMLCQRQQHKISQDSRWGRTITFDSVFVWSMVALRHSGLMVSACDSS